MITVISEIKVNICLKKTQIQWQYINLISLSMFIISFQCVVNLIAILHIHYKTENLLFIPVVGLNQRDQVHSRYKQKYL